MRQRKAVPSHFRMWNYKIYVPALTVVITEGGSGEHIDIFIVSDRPSWRPDSQRTTFRNSSVRIWSSQDLKLRKTKIGFSPRPQWKSCLCVLAEISFMCRDPVSLTNPFQCCTCLPTAQQNTNLLFGFVDIFVEIKINKANFIMLQFLATLPAGIQGWEQRSVTQ